MSLRMRGVGSQRGQGLVEYSLILVLVALIVVVMLLTTGGQMKDVFSNIESNICLHAFC